jgi:hypothetical protein
MNLWLDDIRTPPARGIWHWVKTADEAIKALDTFRYEWASLDHDLADEHYHGNAGHAFREKTGFSVVLWMAEFNIWPSKGVVIHSWNFPGADRMRKIVDRYGPYSERCQHVRARSITSG